MRKLLTAVVGMATLAVCAGAAFGGAARADHSSGPVRFVGATNASGTAQLAVFTNKDPEIVESLTSIGLAPNEAVLGLDVRQDTGALYAKTRICVAGVCSGDSRLYTVQLNMRASTATFSPTGASFASTGNTFGVDFNPTVDRVRVVSESNENRRVNPDNGAPLVDLPLAFAGDDANAGADPTVTAAAYIPAPFGGATTLFDVDTGLDVLATQNPANDGVLRTVGPLGVDVSAKNGFDIFTTGGRMPKTTAFAALQPAGQQQSKLYTINLQTGKARAIANIGMPQPLEALAALGQAK
jgi:hypothetical protein